MDTATITPLWSILLQPLLRLYDLYCYSNYYVFMIYIVTVPITYLWPILLQHLLRPMLHIATATITSLCSLLLQQLLRPYDLYCYSNYYVSMIYIVTATLTFLWSILLQQLLRLYELYCYNTYHVFMNCIVTTTSASLWSIWLQQLSRLNDPYCYSTYYVPMIHIATATITSLWPTLLQHISRLPELNCYSNYYALMIYMVTTTTPITSYDPYRYSNYFVLMIHIATATITSLWFILLQPITSLWSLYPVNVRHAPIAATEGPPPDAPYQERPGGRHAKHPRICLLCYHVFFLFCHLCYSISAELKTISREDAHLMYPRYLRVFSFFVMIYCPLPHPISVRTGWGITVVYLCGF